jgi:hypothetical protein
LLVSELNVLLLLTYLHENPLIAAQILELTSHHNSLYSSPAFLFFLPAVYLSVELALETVVSIPFIFSRPIFVSFFVASHPCYSISLSSLIIEMWQWKLLFEKRGLSHNTVVVLA